MIYISIITEHVGNQTGFIAVSSRFKCLVRVFNRFEFGLCHLRMLFFFVIYELFLLSIHPITSCVHPRAHSIDEEVSSNRCEIRFLN